MSTLAAATDLPESATGRARKDWRYQLLRVVCASIGLPYFRPRVEYTEALPGAPFIVACNHTTLLDWAAIAHFVPAPVRFLVTREYYDLPYVGWFCRWGGAIPVRPGRIGPSAVRLALEALDRGEVVGVFPEGRITRDGAMLPFQRGVVELAARARCPIVPATIRGAYEAFPRHARVPRPRRVVVAFGRAMPPGSSAPAPGGREWRHHAAVATRELQGRIASLAAG